MRLQLPELQDEDKEAKALRVTSLPEDWEDVEGVLQYRGLAYVLEIIRFEVINRHHNDLFVEHFGIDKTKQLTGRKYYWPNLRKNVWLC